MWIISNNKAFHINSWKFSSYWKVTLIVKKLLKVMQVIQFHWIVLILFMRESCSYKNVPLGHIECSWSNLILTFLWDNTSGLILYWSNLLTFPSILIEVQKLYPCPKWNERKKINEENWNRQSNSLEQLSNSCGSEAASQRWSWEKVFWKYAANLQENNHAEVWFQ